eukprot:gb/GFBE01047763.1/.p1 GENE.gb/GFBE01047763.1/~~gb/GFBE01047763.1/.p1  ORF type:complete len:160 (+),score=27.15 gb/GFBE01047763.1/:1-480(+)
MMRRWGLLRGLRPHGVPRMLKMPSWYWDDQAGDCSSEEDEMLLDDEARLRALEARLDRECGADARNTETFGEVGAGDTWTFEDALAANQRLAAGSGGPSPARPTEPRAMGDGMGPGAPAAVGSRLLPMGRPPGDANEAAMPWAAFGRPPVTLDPTLVLQ